MMKKLLVFLLLNLCLTSLFSAKLYVNLLDFMMITSKTNNVRIVADESLDLSTYHFIYTDNNDKLSLDEFRHILLQKDLYLYQKDDIYIVSDKSRNISDLRSIKLDNVSSSKVLPIVNLFDLNATYEPHNNTLYFRSDEMTYNQVKSNIKNLDFIPEVANFKLVITESNLNDLKNKGTDLISVLKPLNHSDLSLYVNLLTSPYLSNSNIIKDKSSAYFGILNFLQQKEIIKIISSPFITAFNDTEVFFSSVNTIPYLTNQSQVTSSQSSTTSSYNYKDVGLKVKLKPVFLKGGIRLDLHLVIEDLLDNQGLTPTTSKKELKSSYFLQRGEILVLSGINKNNKRVINNGVPVLKDIWLLKYLFSAEKEVIDESILTLSIEVN
ncbi:Type 3 secretion system secretin [Campylobacter majalis]|uniref:Type 3 secretion system secretin n=2 Tax=Campylobacter majalis TaxID=2790656 RepID=A0ABN7K455_9BACT|nr:Type 3 secretion system secretin [Campylobacter majalis]